MAEINIPNLPIIKHRNKIFRDGFLSMAIIGKSGCGKTRMLASILPGISDSIKTVLIATIIKGVPLHEGIVNYFRVRGARCGIGNTPDEMQTAVTGLEATGEVTLRRQGLIIFDDFNDGRAIGPYWNFVIHAFTKLRNSGWNFIIITQQPTFIPTIVRNCTTSRVLFDCATRSALTGFTKDVSDRISDRDGYDLLLDYIRRIPYTYILVQEHPFEVCAGKLNEFKVVMDQSSVKIPTLKELEKEMGVTSVKDLNEESQRSQIKAGNNNWRLYL